MKRTPLLFLLCLTLLVLGLFHFEPSKAKNEFSNDQQGHKLRPASERIKSSQSAAANLEQFETEKTLSATLANPPQDQKPDIKVGASYQNDTSIPLRKMKPHPVVSKTQHEANKNPKVPAINHKDSPDPVVQDRFGVLTNVATPNMPSPVLNFDGIPFPGVACNCAPPDTNGEVGATQYVQIANEGFQVFDKTTGASVLGPLGISTIWSGFSGPCETSGSGDPVVLYDQLANRWVISQFAGAVIPTDECVAVSTTSDATGSYHRYGFHLGSNFFDYPKLAVWPDAYYMSMNVFNSSATSYLGPQPFALDRAKMLAGLPATFITTGITGPGEAPYLPADLDGSILPPTGAPATFLQWPGNRVFHFHVDFANPLTSTFTLFASPAGAGFTFRSLPVPQLGTTSGLDPLGDRLMFRAATRFFPDGHESLVSNFTVESGGVAAVRWFELRNPTLGPVTVFQQGTYQPDTTHRWMGSAAMDQQGNLAVGYSASSSSINPQIRYAGRFAGDPLNTLPQAEAILFAGTGSQINTGGRWGDYSAMTIDPVDDCTFWYTNEYYATTSEFNWRTRIGSFKFPGCGLRTLTVASTNPSSGVSITVSPTDTGGLGNGTTQFSRTYNNNTTVNLTAPLTAGGNNFQKWQRNGVDFSVNRATSVTLDANYTMTAVYVTPQRTLTVASTNPSSGVSVTVSPTDNSGLGNGTTQFSRTYNNNTIVNLTAPLTAGGNNFQKWQRNGVDFSVNRATSVTLDANYTMTAVYVTPPRTVTVASTNPSSGVSITVSPTDNSGLGNGTTQFSRTYNHNTTVSLTAPLTAGGNNFQKWQRNGVDFSVNRATSVTLDANYTMTAIYVTPQRTLTVASVNPTSGVVITVSPNDIGGLGNGTTPFSRTYNNNTTVNLTAPATAGGNSFQKWQRNGVDWATSQTTSVTLDADYTMTAVYVTPQRTLTVASVNPSSGVSITVSPNDNSGLGNGTTQFSRTYNNNTTVSLIAPITVGGNNFEKWQRNGVDWVTFRGTSVTLDANYTMTAVYVTPPRSLTVASVNPSSGVSITVSPNDIGGLGNGITQFSRSYNHNTTVSLTAPATAGGNNFQKWQRNGVDWSVNLTTTVTMDANYVMRAVYVTPTRTLTVASVNPSSNISITVSPNDNSGLGNGITQFSRTYTINTNVTLTAPATVGGNNFQKWQRNGVDWATTQTTSVTLDVNYTMTAVYVTGVTSEPVGFWKFDENGGTTAADSSVSGNTGTLTSGAGWGIGQKNSAVSLDGVDDYVQVGAQSSLVMSNSASFTAWIHPTGPGSQSVLGGIIINKEGEYEIARFPDGTIQWAFANANPGWNWINTGAVAPLNQWTHVAVVYESGIVKTYINGMLTHTHNGAGAIGDVDATHNDFRIGGRQVTSHHFQGRIDEVQVYNKALTASEIIQLINVPGLKGHWKFDENTGTTAADSSGSGNTGTLTSGAGWAIGQNSSAVSLDGVDDYVQMGARPSLVMTNIASFTAWIHPTGAGSQPVLGGIIINKEGEYEIARFPDGTIQWAFANTAPGWNWINTGAVAPLNQWTHVAVVYESGVVKTYLNGVLAHTHNGSGPIVDVDTTNNDFRIGGRQVTSHHFQGRIDEVRIYDQALTASDIIQLMDNSGLKGYWKFDENAGTTAADSSVSGNTGTLTSGAGWGIGQNSSAVSLDGVDDYVQVGAQSSLVMSNSASFTAWIHPTGSGSQSVLGGIIINKEGEYEIARFPDGTIQWAFANANPGWNWINTGAVAPLNQWTHVAVVYESGIVKTYLNGILAHTHNGAGAIGDVDATNNDFRIGGRQVTSHHFQGRIDEVQVYNRALTASEIAQLTGN